VICDVCGNPTAVEDAKGRVHLLLTRNPADAGEESGRINRAVWVMRSSDQGRTWQAPQDITKDAKRASWKWYATGPGHGTRLQHQQDQSRNGRSVVSLQLEDLQRESTDGICRGNVQFACALER